MPTNADRPRKQTVPRAAKTAAGARGKSAATAKKADKPEAKKAATVTEPTKTVEATAKAEAAAKKATEAAREKAAAEAAKKAAAEAARKKKVAARVAESVEYRVPDQPPTKEGEKKMAETGGNAIKFIGETVLPGASQILDGEFKSGALHFIGAALARAVFGPIGHLFVAANSYSKSVTGKPVHQHFTG